MPIDLFQIFVIFEGRTTSFYVSDQTNINDFKKELAKKFKLPYIIDMDTFPELKSRTPFYLIHSGKRLDVMEFNTILDYNRYYTKYNIIKESTIRLTIIFSSKIWNMIQEKVIVKSQFIID